MPTRKRTQPTIRNAACGEEELEGEAVEVVAADITVSQSMVTENRYTYYVRRSDDFIVKAIYDQQGPVVRDGHHPGDRKSPRSEPSGAAVRQPARRKDRGADGGRTDCAVSCAEQQVFLVSGWQARLAPPSDVIPGLTRDPIPITASSEISIAFRQSL